MVGEGVPARMVRRGADGLRRTGRRQFVPARPPPLHDLKDGPLDGAARIGVAAEADQVNRRPPALVVRPRHDDGHARCRRQIVRGQGDAMFGVVARDARDGFARIR